MKFRRKSAEPADGPAVQDGPEGDESTGTAEAVPAGPYDVDDVPGGLDAGVDRIDLGALLLPNIEGLDIELQVEEETDQVQSVVLGGTEGAVELRAFAAPRGGNLWDEIRPKIAAEYAQRGGTASEREGRYGTELVCQLTVRGEDGRTLNQPARVVGINGARWLLRATLLGRAAVEPDYVGPWDEAIAQTVVRRGAGAMPVGAELQLTLPPSDQLVRRER
ncbi:DUF3710 domain-containing protein [Nocardioides sp. URHA0020]|uniref:DUF3710 domain-containing protein n=1 Tax=Nocardioides sp. URHA0020 TaxID=1380392 RepID=UPI00048F446C|nr:DUF3710 domain-containing protein [Nocardioides sp. URHA0020]